MVPLSPRLLDELRAYWKEYRPVDFRFPGKTRDKRLRRSVDAESDEMFRSIGRDQRLILKGVT